MILDRRRLLSGGWPVSRAPKARGGGRHSFAIVVQLRPDRIDSAIAAISARDGIDVLQRLAAGRVTFSLSGEAARDIAGTLAAVSDLPGVLSAMPTVSFPSRSGEVSA